MAPPMLAGLNAVHCKAQTLHILSKAHITPDDSVEVTFVGHQGLEIGILDVAEAPNNEQER